MVRKFVISNLPAIILILLLVPFYAILYKLYIPRITAFGCFDDCFNYVGGYFIANGKVIYKDFFFNHQPIPAIISYFVQSVTHPINIFELILRHRQFLLLFGFLFNALFIVRFRYIAVPFILTFELGKFYIFGDRFLAEGMIIYPLVYLLCLTLLKLTKQKLYTVDYLLSAVFTWFVIFSREPYIPLAFLLFIIIFWGKLDRFKKVSIAVFAILTAALLIYIGDLKEYYFNLVTFNFQAVLPADLNVDMFGPKPLQIFLYPFYIFFYGGWNIFKQLLIGLDIIFLFYLSPLLKKREFKLSFFIFLILGFSNFRVVLPGVLFYESYHLIVWFGLFIFTVSFLIYNYSKNNTIKFFSPTAFSLILLSLLSSRYYFAREKIDTQFDFLTNFGSILHTGETIKHLSNKNDSLFLDRSDDLIYWQANRMSDYKYLWYTSQMNHFPKYSEERLKMFRDNPPVFYKEFGTCPKKNHIPDAELPDFVKDKYVRLYSGKDLSCLLVRKDKIGKISDAQWKKAEELLYTLHPK